MEPNKNNFSSTDIETKIGIKRNRLKEWVPKYIQPSVLEAKGQGTRNRFSKVDIYKILVFKKLIDRGFSREDAALRVSYLQNRIYRLDMTIDDVNFLGFVSREKGKYLSGKPKVEGIGRPFDIAYPDIIIAKNLPEVSDDLVKMNFINNQNDDVVIVNFKAIREFADNMLQ
jgi:hypothetical protein